MEAQPTCNRQVVGSSPTTGSDAASCPLKDLRGSSMDDRLRVPAALKTAARSVVWRATDTVESLRGELIHPKRLRTQVPGDFRDVGSEFLRYSRELAGLTPDNRVLDIGCGPGRMALPLTGFIS